VILEVRTESAGVGGRRLFEVRIEYRRDGFLSLNDILGELGNFDSEICMELILLFLSRRYTFRTLSGIKLECFLSFLDELDS
jgi:hypothetical protein